MIDPQTLDYLLQKLHERRAELAEFMSHGNLKDFSEYQKLCGNIQGLGFAEQIVTDLAKRLEQIDE